MAEKQSFDFLWNCALCLSSRIHTERLLKSYYITTCYKLAKNNVLLPTNNFGSGRMCTRCGNQWCDGNYQLRLRPATVSETLKRRRQVSKLEEVQQRGQKTQTLSRGARKRAKWLKKRMASNVEVGCTLCRYKTMLALERPKGKQQQTKVQVEQATIERKAAATGSKTNKKKKIKKQKNHSSRAITTTTRAPLAVKKHKAQSKATHPPPPLPSKTQKKNALLQLAAQLKANSLRDSAKTQHNRLHALLK